jgi:CDP-6-deoxy-D-xylo-4-hexulose-3-dehydrase
MNTLPTKINHPLMENNIDKNDIKSLILFLKNNPRLTASKKVFEFEKKWSNWLGVKYSVFVNSGSSANFLTIRALKIFLNNKNKNEIITPSLTWNSDIVAVLESDFKPVFCDISLSNLAMNFDDVKNKINKNTAAVFLSHIQGFNGLSDKFIKLLKKKNIMLIEDVCESHGAKFKHKKCGSFGLASNFSFYYAHHISTIEGGMISTNDKNFYNICCMLRAHGLVRESKDEKVKKFYKNKYRDLNKEFIFFDNGFNMRSTEINAVLGISQLKKINQIINQRNKNFKFFLQNLNKEKFFTDFNIKGVSNYAFPLILKNKNFTQRNIFENKLKKYGIEFRRGNAGGGNQLRQPYLKKFLFDKKNFKNVEHIHHFGYYIGNYPTLKKTRIKKLLNILNSI